MIGNIGIIIAGLGIIMLGYLIWFKKMLSLIIGYNEATFYGDKNKYAKRVGLMAMIIGVFVISLPVATMIFGEMVKQIYAVIAVFLVIILVAIASYWRFRY